MIVVFSVGAVYWNEYTVVVFEHVYKWFFADFELI